MPARKIPDSVKRLRGNPGGRPLENKEPVFPSDVPPPPEWLHGQAAALAMWERVTKLMAESRIITPLDFAAVDDFVWVSMQLDEHRRQLNHESVVMKAKRGGATLNARARWIRDLTKLRESLTMRLGFSPTMRGKLTALPGQDSDRPPTSKPTSKNEALAIRLFKVPVRRG